MNELESLRASLLDLDWLQTRLRTAGVEGLLDTFRKLGPASDRGHRLLEQAVALSSHVLLRNPEELASQLRARLLSTDEPALAVLLERTASAGRRPSLIPRHGSLPMSAGDALVRTLDVRPGSIGGVYALAVLPDSDHVLVAADRLELWSIERGRRVSSFESHAAVALGLSPDGRRSFSGANDTSLQVWDLTRGRLLFDSSRRPQRGSVRSISIHTDGRRALVGAWDVWLDVWDFEHGRLLHSIDVEHPVQAAVFYGERHALCAPARAGQDLRSRMGLADPSAAREHPQPVSTTPALELWDLESGRCVRRYPGSAEILRMEIVPDSGLAVLKSASGLEILDLESGERVHSPEPTGYGSALALTRDGKSALANAAPGSFASWNLAGQRVCSFGPHDCGVVAVACTPDGKHAVSGSSEGTVKVWDLSRGSETPKRAAHRIHLTGLLLGDAGRRALLATGTTVELWDAERCQRIGLLPSSGFTHALALCPSGNRALSSGDALQLWDLRTGELLRTFGEGSGVSCMAFSPDGQHLVAATGESEELTIWDLERGALMRKAAFERVCYQVSSLAISANGRLAVTACNDDGPCLVWDLVHLRVVREYDMHVNALALAPDGLHALHASWNGLHEFNLATGAIRRSFLGHTAAVVDVALSRDGERAGSVSFDKTVRLWSSSGEPLATFSADQGLARVAIDGDRVVAADQSGQLHILDV